MPAFHPLDPSGTEIFETHEHVIIKVKIAKEEDPRALQVFVKSNQIKLTGFRMVRIES